MQVMKCDICDEDIAAVRLTLTDLEGFIIEISYMCKSCSYDKVLWDSNGPLSLK